MQVESDASTETCQDLHFFGSGMIVVIFVAFCKNESSPEYDTGDNQLWVQGQLSTRLADTHGQGQAAPAGQGDVPQEGKVSGEKLHFRGKEVLNVSTF